MADYDVAIVGGGVTGTALAYVLSSYTNIRRIALIEKNADVATVNSHPRNNSQTLHDGGIETNYGLSHALDVRSAAMALRRYVETKDDPALFKRTLRMVLGVGAREVRDLEQRYEVFRGFYPDLRLARRDELALIEPKLIEGRDPAEPVCALVSDEGYAIDFQKLSRWFLTDAATANPELAILLNTKVKGVARAVGGYLIDLGDRRIFARSIIFAAGPYSLLFAQELGYGKDYAILPMAGSFFSGGPLLRGKVYRVQIEGMPFAAVHGDPDVLNPQDTRFGPTTKPLPLMERHRYKTFFDFLKLPLISFRGLCALYKILSSKKLVRYAVKNAIFDLPVVGKWLFLREVRPIVPTIRYRDLKLRRGGGGIRPQLVDLRTGELQMSEGTIVGAQNGDRLIFNTTPSPGASVCLGNAERDAAQIVKLLGGAFAFDAAAYRRDYVVTV